MHTNALFFILCNLRGWGKVVREEDKLMWGYTQPLYDGSYSFLSPAIWLNTFSLH